MNTAFARSVGGVVYAEFLISFMCFFTLFVSAVQLSVVATARLVVQHAAVQATRAAVVTIDDDPVFYEDGQRKHLETKGSGKGGGTASKALALVAGNVTMPSGLGARGTERLNRIRNAAYLPLSVISPTAGQVARWVPFATTVSPELAERSIYDDIGDLPIMRVVTGFGVYGRIGAAITFPDAPASKTLRSAGDAVFGERETVTVRVTYLLPCNVPLGRDLVCDSVLGLSGIPDAIRASADAMVNPSFKSFEQVYSQWTRAPSQVKKLKQGMRELMRAEWASLQLGIITRLSERFIILTGEASLPNHGAPYKYYSELKSKQGGKP